MNLCDSLYTQLEALELDQWSQQLQQLLPQKLSTKNHGKYDFWQQTLQQLPLVSPSVVELKERVEIGCAADLGDFSSEEFTRLLKTLHHWRKGPFNLFGVDIDTEWRSDWKWQRLLPHIQPLAGRRVLDVGCGNGYHGWRMRGEGAELVIGIDPTLLYVVQFQVLQRYLNDPQHHLLPLRMEEMPAGLNCFDSVFSMGVLYHRRSPLDHLLELKSCLRQGGELVLETLIVEGGADTAFMPTDRYAKMRNVWFLPSVDTLTLWLQRCGYKDIACVDINRTSIEEQRRTAWMHDESLANYLDPQNPLKTIEGHPAPLRAIFTASK